MTLAFAPERIEQCRAIRRRPWRRLLRQAQAIAPAQADYLPTDPQMAWHLARFIEQVRSIPADPIIVRQNWLRAYEFTTDRGALALNDYARSSDPFSKVGKSQIAVDVSSVNHVQRFHDSFSYQAGSWGKKRRVVAKVEWHPGELYPRVGFIVTNLTRPAKRVVAFYNQRGTVEQHIKEGKNAILWTRLSCRKFQHNSVRLQLHALACNLANFMRTLALPEAVKHWSLTSLREKLVKIGARIVGHGRYVTFQMAEVAVSGGLFGEILRLIAQLRAPPVPI